CLQAACPVTFDDRLGRASNPAPAGPVAHVHARGSRCVVGRGRVVHHEALARAFWILDDLAAVHEAAMPYEHVAALAGERPTLEALLPNRFLHPRRELGALLGSHALFAHDRPGLEFEPGQTVRTGNV